MPRELLAPGDYRGKAMEAQVGEAGTGTPQVAVRFDFLDYDETNRVWYGYFTPSSMENTFKALRTAGWKGNDLEDLSDLFSDNDPPEVVLVVQHEPDQQGNMRDRIRFINSVGSSAGAMLKKKLEGKDLSDFAARMKGEILAFDQRQSGGARPATKSKAKGKNGKPKNAPAPAATTDDDPIPF